jgi:hypothetical protein
MNMERRIRWVAVIILGLFLTSCSYQQTAMKKGGLDATSRHVAVLPLINLTTYPNAGRIVTDLMTTEFYALTDFRILEQTTMMEKLKAGRNDLDEALDRAVAHRIGGRLGVDTVVYGTVTEYRYKRGLDEDPVVGINVRMLDVESGTILWAGSKSSTGGCFWFCEDSLNRVAQKVCRDLVSDMVKHR